MRPELLRSDKGQIYFANLLVLYHAGSLWVGSGLRIPSHSLAVSKFAQPTLNPPFHLFALALLALLELRVFLMFAFFR
jgi:hypothetical protein